MNEAEEVSIFELFRMEAQERVESLQRLLLALQNGEGGPGELHALMREAHSLKGAARIAELGPAVRLTHAMEDRFLAAEQGQEIEDAQLDALLRAVDLLRDISEMPEEATARSWAAANDGEMLQLARALGSTDAAEPKRATAPERMPEALEEFAPAPPAGAMTSVPIADPGGSSEGPAGNMTLRITSARFNGILAGASDTVVKAQSLLNLAEGLRQGEMQLDQALGRLAESTLEPPKEGSAPKLREMWEAIAAEQRRLRERMRELEEAVHGAEAVAGSLHREILRARMRPLGEIVSRLQRLVRSVGAELGKRVRLEIVGEGTEVDSDILERLSAPLEHLIRNALDHGLESTEARRASGKKEEGRLRLWARHHNGRLAITLSDDGSGINIAAVREQAQRLGLVFPGITAELSDEEVLQFLFLPGFSTRQAVSEISGRGFGLDVVQTMVQGAGGAIRMETRPGVGTTIHLTLPISRSVVRVMLVGAEDEVYALPMERLSRVASLTVEVDGRGRPTVDAEGKAVPIVSFGQALAGAGARVEAGHTIAVFLLEESGAEAEMALGVDRLLGDSLVAVRQLDPRIGRSTGVAGVTLSESGVPMLIIDTDEMLSTALGAIRRRKTIVTGEDHRATVLIADDSHTVRQMLRRVLVRANYRVVVATQGAEAWALLQSQPFDLLISDVDMPEMTGIELTERVRANARLGHLPVVLLSYKGREEDRRRGLHAGADVYFSKGEFEESAFLQVVTDLIGPAGMEPAEM